MDNRQIVSGSRDKTIKLWNTLAECKYTIQDDGHTDWVSCVRFSPNHANPIIVSAGWDRVVKVKMKNLNIFKERRVNARNTHNILIRMMIFFIIFTIDLIIDLMSVCGYGTDIEHYISLIIAQLSN